MVISNFENSRAVLYLSGRVDSSNAAEFENQINAELEGHEVEELVCDVDKIEYISSAGLRVILRLKKSYSNFSIVNASPEVYEIFDMTGFTEMMDISKAYRRLSVEGCEVIGQGANGIVYRIDKDTIVKVYFNSDALPDIHRERELARTAFVLGVPTAIPYDVVRVGESYGSVFELLDAKSLTSLIADDLDTLEKNTSICVDLLKVIHSTEVKTSDMPDMKAVALDWADFLKEYLPEENWQKLHNLIEAVADNHHMIHGDYHMKNVMMQNGEALLIDMDTLAYGAPVFEFASIFNAYVGFSAVDHEQAMKFQGLSYEACQEIWSNILKDYFGTEDKDVLAAYEDKAALVGYTRLMRRLIRRNGFDTEQGRKEIEFFKQQIIDLSNRVDTLEF